MREAPKIFFRHCNVEQVEHIRPTKAVKVKQQDLMSIVFADGEGNESMWIPRWRELKLIVRVALLIETLNLGSPIHIRSLKHLHNMLLDKSDDDSE